MIQTLETRDSHVLRGPDFWMVMEMSWYYVHLFLFFNYFFLEATLGEDTEMSATSGTVLVIFAKMPFQKFPITTKLTFLLNNYAVTLATAFWKTSYRWRFYEHGSRYILIRSSRFKKISWNENQRRCLENYHSQKNTTLHLKEHCTKIDGIWLVILHFFFLSQTNLAFTEIIDSFCHSLFTFLPFDFWYSTYFPCSTEFIQCPYTFFID